MVCSDEVRDMCCEPLTLTAVVSREPFYFVASLFHRLFDIDFEVSQPFILYNAKSKKYNDYDAYNYFSEVDRLLYWFVDSTQYRKKKSLLLNTYILIILGRDCKGITDKINKELKEHSAFNSTIVHSYQKYFDNAMYEAGEINVSQDVSTCEQGSLFDYISDNPYQRVKSKRANVTKSPNILQAMIESFRQDLDCNLYNVNTKLTR